MCFHIQCLWLWDWQLGAIASVVNQMWKYGRNRYLGTLIFIVVFIIGHAFNMAINLLGAYVHTNRLQYVEFFGKFYEGGGRPSTHSNRIQNM